MDTSLPGQAWWAARLLDASFSFTLHGSDLLVRADYLDCKLKHCKFCVTVSEFNRNYILSHDAAISSEKILVHRLGIDLSSWCTPEPRLASTVFTILSVGRLHPVKNYSFLLLACHALKSSGLQFRCDSG
jgi:glycosyltransferase involved in cell wall biosynthesis